MLYREIDYSKDIQEIVNLLLTSLSNKNSREHFIWKHIENPFGKSYGLLACENDKIIGVRMFMFWKFEKGGEIIRALRPVDTITHPDYRGKGIFKKLTLDGLRNCSGKYDLIFNTPNKKSLPGYLKMGWEKHKDKLQYKLGIIFPLFSSSKLEIEKVTSKDLTMNLVMPSQHWTTYLTDDYLQWRYAAPVYEKVLFKCEETSGYVVYRLKKVKGIKILVLLDYRGEKYCINSVIRGLATKNKTIFVYYLSNDSMNSFNPLSFKRQQSIVVYKEDQRDISSELLFSTGDLEGRL